MKTLFWLRVRAGATIAMAVVAGIVAGPLYGAVILMGGSACLTLGASQCLGAAGDSVLVAAQTKAAYRGQNSALIGQAFDAILDVTASNSNILAHLQGPVGGGTPFVLKTELQKGAMDTVNFNVGTSLGQAGRRGTQRAVNYEEPLFHNSWNVQIDNLRVVVGFNEINRVVATSGKVWGEVYAELCGERLGQIEQEDMLMRLRQRAASVNTVRPGNKPTLNALRYDSTLDTQSLGLAISLLNRRGAKPAMITKSQKMPVNGFVALGSETMFSPLWSDPAFSAALLHAEVDGPDNPYWTGKIPMWKGTAIKQWYVVDHDSPGPIGSSIEPRAVLGDPIVSGNGALTIYGGGRTQASLGDAAALYTPFTYFYGNNYLFGESITYGTDDGPYNFIVIDPADGMWCLYEYAGGSGINNNGNSITCTKRLASADAHTGSNIAYQTVGAWTWDAEYNKDAFPTGALIVQVNDHLVPVGDVWLFGENAGAKCYGSIKNKRISQDNDYGALVGVGVQSIFGCDLRKDTQSSYRGFVRLQGAYELIGFELPQIS